MRGLGRRRGMGITEVFGFSQVSECFRWIGSSLPCASSSSEAAFRRTFLNKLDDTGQPRMFDVVDRRTNQVTRTPLLSYVEDVATGDLYLDEEWHVLATKCAAVALGNPLYALGTEVWHFTKMLIVVGVVAMDAIKKMGEQFCQGDAEGAGATCWNWITETGSALSEGIWGMASTPFYALGVEFAALYGIFDQYRGRKWVAAIEHSWQKGASYKEDHEWPVRNENQHCWDSFVQDLKKARTHYLANCFQVRGNVRDANIRVIRSEAL